MRPLRAALIVCCLLAACAERSEEARCGAGERVVIAQMLFGRAIGTDAQVSEADWLDFVAATMTPNFPDGLTIHDALGQWRDPATDAVVREPSKLVVIVASDARGAADRLERIAEAYKTRFRQHAVGVFLTPACGRFR